MNTQELATDGVTPETPLASEKSADQITEGATEATEGNAPKDAKAEEADKAASEAAKTLADRKKQKAEESRERWNTMRRESFDNLARAQKAEKELAEYKAKLKAPSPDDYDDNAKYTADTIQHKLDENDIKRREGEINQQRQSANRAIAEQWTERVDAFKADAPDFEQVAYRAPISDETAHLIAQMEEGPQIAYALGKNIAEVRRIERLPEAMKAVELGKIAARLSNPTPKKTTQAPEPIVPVLGRGSSTSPDPEKMNFNEFKAYREKGGKINM